MTGRRIPIAERVAAFQAYYRRENRRPLLGFFLGSEYPIPRYEYPRGLATDRRLTPGDFDPAAHARAEAALFDAHETCGGYFIHAGSAYWGIPWLEAIMGCSIAASQETGSLYAEPLAAESGADSPATGAWQPPGFDPESPWVTLAGEMLEALGARAQGRFPLATTRMRGVADMLAAVFGGEELIIAMLEQPEYVTALTGALTDLYIAFARYQLDRIPSFHGGVGSFYYSMWAPPRTVWHQEDSCMLLSPDLYDRFIRSQDERIFRAFDANIVHFHSTGGYLPIEPVLSMRPTAVELHRDSGGPSAESLTSMHRRILEDTPLLIWGALTEADLEWVFTRLPAEGLAVQVAVESIDEAHWIWDRWGGEAL